MGLIQSTAEEKGRKERRGEGKKNRKRTLQAPPKITHSHPIPFGPTLFGQ
jgi:hypothetical protein